MLASMRVVVVTSQKGGSGKTTLAGHLAVQALRAGHEPVTLVDTDPQGSLAAWWNVRKADTPYFVQTTLARLFHDLEALRQRGTRLVVIDTPPAVTGTIRGVVAHADLVLIPTRPSPHDLRAVAGTLDIVEGRGKPLVFVVNGATPKARITADAVVALSQHGIVAPVTIHHRNEFASSMIDGRTVMECGAAKSSQEIADLWDYVADRLRGIAPHPAPAFDRTAIGRFELVTAGGAPFAAAAGFGRRTTTTP